MVIAMDLADTHTNYLQLSVKKIGRLIARRPIFASSVIHELRSGIEIRTLVERNDICL